MEKILSIVWYKILPAVFGGQKGIASFYQHLSKHYSITCLCSENNEAPANTPYKVIAALPVSKWQFIDPACHAKIKSAARSEQARYLLLEHPYHALAAFAAKRSTGAKLIVHSHNIESQRFREIGKWWWRILAKYEKWIHRKADLNIFKTITDHDFAVRHFGLSPKKCMVAPYGAEKHDLPDRSIAIDLVKKRHGIGATEKILLFAGTLDYMPNAKAVENIYREIAPRLANKDERFRIIICGRNRFSEFNYLQQLSHEGVIQAGEIMDIENYFAAADAFINPTEWSGGIQTKNIDALSWHCNIVCFDELVEKDTLSTAPEKIFTVAALDWDGFTSQIIRATDRSLPTPPAFFSTYNWEKIAASVAVRIATLDFTVSLQDRQ